MSKTTKIPNVHSDSEQIGTSTDRHISGLSHEEQSKFIAERARKATSNAAMDALKNGRAITIQQGNDIVRKFPGGRVEKIKTLDNAFVIPKKRVYKI
ncbi:hypothetical protein [uncultured Methanolobus sp.]|uniref:hypothetical protein n=1 Tax=uncultured Methanolobus sp. TaxID=218300 RepID=UPI0029C84B8E|nr:hypothetical protein [uncultured Methanolobus sp.]